MGPSLIDPAVGRRALRKAALRLIPFLCALYALNILDRANAGFARLTMQKDLQLGDAAFDIGYGLFYLGYLLFEVPANHILRHVGARVWIACIVVIWGLVSCATMFVRDEWGFIAVRVLLGVAQAGFFPGIVLYLTFWFPARQRAAVMAWFMAGIALSGIIGNPLHGQIVGRLHDVGGLRGWQWLFLLEGIPAVLLGVATLWALTDKPADASWLSAAEREWLAREMADEEARQTTHQADHWRAMVDGRVWLLIALYATVATCANAAGAYFPTLIQKQFRTASSEDLGWLNALPHVAALVAMTLWGWSSDRTRERRAHVGVAAYVAAIGWAIAASASNPYVSLVGLCIAQAGMISMLPTFWTLPPTFLTGAAAAGGIALINSVANLGGLFGPYVLGYFGPWSMAVVMAFGLPLAALVTREREGGPGPATQEKKEELSDGITVRPDRPRGDGLRRG